MNVLFFHYIVGYYPMVFITYNNAMLKILWFCYLFISFIVSSYSWLGFPLF